MAKIFKMKTYDVLTTFFHFILYDVTAMSFMVFFSPHKDCFQTMKLK